MFVQSRIPAAVLLAALLLAGLIGLGVVQFQSTTAEVAVATSSGTDDNTPWG